MGNGGHFKFTFILFLFSSTGSFFYSLTLNYTHIFRLQSAVGSLGVDCTEQVQNGADHSQNGGHHELLVQAAVILVDHLHEEEDRGDDVQNEGHRVVDQFLKRENVKFSI